MSYILDALKKSEAERNRGVAPSLFAGNQDQLKSRVGLWVLFVALLINACVGGYWLYSRSDRVAPQPTAVASAVSQPQPEQIPEQVVTDQPIAEVKPTPQPISAPTVTAYAPTPTPISAPEVAPRPAVPARPSSNEMELANLSFSTHVYASDPTKRAVTLNGRRLIEGDSISKGVVLKEITETGVILEVNGREVPLDVLQDWR